MIDCSIWKSNEVGNGCKLMFFCNVKNFKLKIVYILVLINCFRIWFFNVIIFFFVIIVWGLKRYFNVNIEYIIFCFFKVKDDFL